jgi:hypothetical protein
VVCKLIEDRVLPKPVRQRLHPNEQKVIACYERTTKRSFMRSELILVKRLIRVATPEQINAIIYQMYKSYAQNFVDFAYIVQPVERMFKHRRGKGKA